MIQPLRRLHFRMAIVAAVTLPLVLLSGLLARRSIPTAGIQLPQQGDWPAEFSGRLKSIQETLAPDVLVYWSPVHSASQALPPEARLLGDLHGGCVSNASLPSDGYVLLYTLAQQKVIAAMPISGKEKQP